MAMGKQSEVCLKENLVESGRLAGENCKTFAHGLNFLILTLVVILEISLAAYQPYSE